MAQTDAKILIDPNVMEKTNVKVFIASSAEVKEERNECVSFLSQINKSHTHLHLEAVEWEYDMVGGSNPGFETIQKAINPKLEECALCVFIFYSKIGKFTEEEFKLASELKKKIIPFFKKGFSPETDKAIAEWRKLVKFKKSMNETNLYKEYQDIKDLELLLTQI